jgi:hypothetical protein
VSWAGCRSCCRESLLLNRFDSDARSGSMGLGGKAARMRLAGSTRWYAREQRATALGWEAAMMTLAWNLNINNMKRG